MWPLLSAWPWRQTKKELPWFSPRTIMTLARVLKNLRHGQKKTQAVVSLTSGSHFKAPKKAHYYCMTPFEFHSFGEKHISTANISSQWLHQQQVRNLGKRCRRRWKLLILMPPLIMVISLISYVMFFSRVTQHVICLYTMYITGNSTHTCHPFVNRSAWLVYIAQKGLDPIIECLVSCTGVEH